MSKEKEITSDVMECTRCRSNMLPTLQKQPVDESVFTQDSNPVVLIDEDTLKSKCGDVCFGCKIALHNDQESSKTAQLNIIMVSLLDSLNEFREAHEQVCKSLVELDETVEV